MKRSFVLSMARREGRSSWKRVGFYMGSVTLGVAAQRLSTKLLFDRETKRFTNNESANQMLVGAPPRKGWEEFYKL